jgi:hypothetical protein
VFKICCIYVKYVLVIKGQRPGEYRRTGDTCQIADVQDMLYLCKICMNSKRTKARRVQENR